MVAVTQVISVETEHVTMVTSPELPVTFIGLLLSV